MKKNINCINIKLLGFVIFLVSFLSACENATPVSPSDISVEEKLGKPVIGGVYRFKGKLLQIYENFVLEIRPNAPKEMQLSIYPVGEYIGNSTSPTYGEYPSGWKFINGYPIGKEFLDFYNENKNLLGSPISAPLYNMDTGQQEQYFLNGGLYYDERSLQVGFMPYGLWFCAKAGCLKDIIVETPGPVMPADIVFYADKVFGILHGRIGTDVLGISIQNLFPAPDGTYMKVYEHLVAYLNPNQLEDIQYLKLPQMLLKLPPAQLEPKIAGMYFVEISDGLGFNVLPEIYEYLARKSGFEVSGFPITQPLLKEDGVSYYQCFEHMCIDYSPNALPESRVSPQHLGEVYLSTALGVNVNSISDISKNNIKILLWEKYNMLPKGTDQQLGLAATVGNQPLIDVTIYVEVYLPDDNQLRYYSLPTDDKGIAWITFPSPDVGVGTAIPYRACLVNLTTTQNCTGSEFYVWEP